MGIFWNFSANQIFRVSYTCCGWILPSDIAAIGPLSHLFTPLYSFRGALFILAFFPAQLLPDASILLIAFIIFWSSSRASSKLLWHRTDPKNKFWKNLLHWGRKEGRERSEDSISSWTCEFDKLKVIWGPPESRKLHLGEPQKFKSRFPLLEVEPWISTPSLAQHILIVDIPTSDR